MTAADALLAACLADPDADLPRLAYADALDDRGDDRYAEFVRVQVELALLAAWEPLAVLARHRRPDWQTGESVRDRLPATGNEYVGWAAEPFRRGLGWAVKVAQLSELLAVGDGLSAAAPVGELHLPQAPLLEEWKALTGRPWWGRVRAVGFTGRRLPIEPVRVFGESPGGLRELRFDQANSPAAAELFGGLARSPLGRQLTGLHLRNGYAAEAEELVEELGSGGLRVGELSLQMVGLTEATGRKLAAGPLLAAVHTLDLSHNQYLGSRGLQAAVPATGSARLRSLSLARTGVGQGAVRWLCWAEPFADLRLLDLTDNRLGRDALEPFAREGRPAGLRALRLAHCNVGDPGVRHLTAAAFWPRLVELDLRMNEIGDAGAKRLLAAAVPPDLTALLLAGNDLGEAARGELRARYGEAVVFDD